jgi:hypothetical protein
MSSTTQATQAAAKATESTLRKWLPGKKMSIFLGLTGSLTAYGFYNSSEFKSYQQDQLCKKAKKLAQEPLQPWEMPRKVIVYVAPTSWSLHWFQKYVQPGNLALLSGDL